MPLHNTGHARAGSPAVGYLSSITRLSGTRDFTQPHVLIIEDEPELVSLLARFLLRLHIFRVCPWVRITHTNAVRDTRGARPTHKHTHTPPHATSFPPHTHTDMRRQPSTGHTGRQAGRQTPEKQAMGIATATSWNLKRMSQRLAAETDREQDEHEYVHPRRQGTATPDKGIQRGGRAGARHAQVARQGPGG